jgi:hypothetical protein
MSAKSDQMTWEEEDVAPPLSTAGRARREAMLGTLEAAMRHRRQRKAAVRVGVALVPALMVGLLLVRFTPATPASSGKPANPGTREIVQESASTPTMAAAAFEWIPASPEGADPEPRRVRLTSLDDSGLQGMLAEAGLPTGIMRAQGRVILASQLVPSGATDEGMTDHEIRVPPRG